MPSSVTLRVPPSPLGKAKDHFCFHAVCKVLTASVALQELYFRNLTRPSPVGEGAELVSADEVFRRVCGGLPRKEKEPRAALFCSAPKAQPDPSRRCHVPLCRGLQIRMQIVRKSAAAVFPYGKAGCRAKKKSRKRLFFCSAPKAQPDPSRRCHVPLCRGLRIRMQIVRKSAAAVFPYGKVGCRAKKKSRERLFFRSAPKAQPVV